MIRISRSLGAELLTSDSGTTTSFETSGGQEQALEPQPTSGGFSTSGGQETALSPDSGAETALSPEPTQSGDGVQATQQSSPTSSGTAASTGVPFVVALPPPTPESRVLLFQQGPGERAPSAGDDIGPNDRARLGLSGRRCGLLCWLLIAGASAYVLTRRGDDAARAR